MSERGLRPLELVAGLRRRLALLPISWSLMMQSRARLKRGKAVGAEGGNAELLQALPLGGVMWILALFNLRACGTDRGPAWPRALTYLVPKLSTASCLAQFRAISIDAVGLKWYLTALLQLARPHLSVGQSFFERWPGP